MVNVIDVQFDKLKTRLNIFIDIKVKGNNNIQTLSYISSK